VKTWPTSTSFGRALTAIRQEGKSEVGSTKHSFKPKFPDWQNEFEAALIEGDPRKLHERVQAAEAAIFLRWQDLFYNSDGHVELEAIRDAMRTLRAIKTERMHYPDWNDK